MDALCSMIRAQDRQCLFCAAGKTARLKPLKNKQLTDKRPCHYTSLTNKEGSYNQNYQIGLLKAKIKGGYLYV
jgi:hypothetical protein